MQSSLAGGLRHRLTVALLLTFALGCPSIASAAGKGAEPPHGASSAPASKPSQPATASAKELVDINSASRKQLTTLPGIGVAEAERIVGGRPYLTKTDLVTQKVLPAGIYQSIRRSIIAKQQSKPAAKS